MTLVTLLSRDYHMPFDTVRRSSRSLICVFGLIGNIIVGIVGAVIGDFLLGLLGINTFGLVGSIISATLGAVVLFFLIGLFKRA